MLRWLLGKRAGAAPPGGAAAEGRPGGEERPGPDPPLPPTANRPGVSVHAATDRAALGESASRTGTSLLGPLDGSPLPSGFCWAAVALAGDARGDVVVAEDGAFDLPAGTPVLLDGVAAGEGNGPLRIGRDALAGEGVAGITGARLLLRTKGRAVLRFGPPPAARWTVAGLRSVAVFAGRLTLVDGEDESSVRPGEVALVSDPTATLAIQAGNDAAIAVAFASPGFVVRLQ